MMVVTLLLLGLTPKPDRVPADWDRVYPQFPRAYVCKQAYEGYQKRANLIAQDAWVQEGEEDYQFLLAASEQALVSSYIWAAAYEVQRPAVYRWNGNGGFQPMDEGCRIVREMELRRLIGDLAFDNGWLPPLPFPEEK